MRGFTLIQPLYYWYQLNKGANAKDFVFAIVERFIAHTLTKLTNQFLPK